jgi:membrane protease YdiL (CAAX protease family)
MSSQRNVALIVTAFWLPVPLNGLVNGLYLEALGGSRLFWLIDLTATLLFPLGILFALKHYVNVLPADYGLRVKHPGSEKLQLFNDSIVCTFWFLVVGIGLYKALWIFLWPFEDMNEIFSYKSVLPDGLLRILVGGWLAISTGFTEEVFYRGILRELLTRLLPPHLNCVPLTFICTSALIFGIVHWEGGLTLMACTFILGGVTARLYLWSGNLWPLICAHATTTFISYVV